MNLLPPKVQLDIINKELAKLSELAMGSSAHQQQLTKIVLAQQELIEHLVIKSG